MQKLPFFLIILGISLFFGSLFFIHEYYHSDARILHRMDYLFGNALLIKYVILILVLIPILQFEFTIEDFRKKFRLF